MALIKLISRGALFAFFLMAIAVEGLQAQETTSMSMLELQSEAQSYIRQKKYLDARPYIEELVLRITDAGGDPRHHTNLPELYYFWAYSFIQEYSTENNPDFLKKAIEKFDLVIKDFPNSRFAMASINTKASCYDTLKNFKEATETRKMLLEKPFVDKLNYSQQLDVIRRIADNLYNNQELELGHQWFQRLFERSNSVNDKVFAASALIQACIKEKDYQGAKKYFQWLVYDTPMRSDIALNVALMNAGDSLVDGKKYSDATLFYSMVLTKEKIIENFKRYIEAAKKEYERALRINPNSDATVELGNKLKYLEARLQIVENVASYSAGLMARSANNYMLTKRDYESFWSFLRVINEFPEERNVEDYYFAVVISAARIGKDAEMFRLANEYLEKFPEGKHEWPIKLRMAQYLVKIKDYPAFFALAKQFVEDYSEEDTASDFVFLMGKTWFETAQYDELINAFDRYLEDYPDTPLIQPTLYWLGLANMVTGHFDNAIKHLGQLTDEYVMSPYSEDASYRLGVAYFGKGDFPKASEVLGGFSDRYPKSNLRGEVEFFLGDILANNSQPEEAIEHYARVETFPNTPQHFIDNSYLQRAKLLHVMEKYEEEAALMTAYIEKYPKQRVSDAALSLGKAKEMLGLPASAMKNYEEIIMKYGSNPADDGVDTLISDYNRMYVENYEKTTASIAFLEQLLTDERLLRDMVGVPARRYRYFVDNPKVDQRLYEKFKRDTAYGPVLFRDKTLIKDLIESYKEQAALYPEGGPEVGFKNMLGTAEAANDVTLKYRLMAGLDEIGKRIDPNKMFTDEEMKQASVKTLVWIGKENEKYGVDSARKAFKEALDRDQIKYHVDALFGLALLEEHQLNWDEVMKCYAEIYEDFPASDRAAEAVLRWGDTLSKLGKRDEAIDKYEIVLSSPTWRGEAYAEALYKLGLIAQREGQRDKAVMYYERCFLGYANCYKWTGKAVLQMVKIFIEAGERADALALCNEFTLNKSNMASPEYDEIKQIGITL